MTTDRSPRTAAVIGAGIAGVTAALGLQQAGFDVTVYSDKNQKSLRDDVPATGTALIFGEAQDAESSLGLDTYADRAPNHTGLSIRIVGPGGQRPELIGFDGSFDGFVGLAVDTRLKADERLTAFIEQGGTFTVEPVTPDTLDHIAGTHDLTLVATGKGGLSDLFPADGDRSVYDEPQRHLLAVTVKGLGYGPEVFAHRSAAGGGHSLFSIFADQGETWWGPYLHKDAGPTWAFLGWARPGSNWDARFATADSANSALAIVKDLYRDYIPWDLPEVESVQVIEEDPHSWLKGAVRPVVRHGVGITASGHPVAALGDTAVAYDPIAAQGAQSGLIQAQRLVAAAAAHDGPFDADWITEQYDAFLTARADAATKVTRLFLGDPEFAEIGNKFFAAAAVDQGVASTLVSTLHKPQPLLQVNSPDDADGLIESLTGQPAANVVSRFRPAGTFARSTYTPSTAAV